MAKKKTTLGATDVRIQGIFKRGHKDVQTHPRSGKKKKNLPSVFTFPDFNILFNRRDCMSPPKQSWHLSKFKCCSQENTQQEKEQVAFNYNKKGFSQLQASLPQMLSLTKRQTY